MRQTNQWNRATKANERYERVVGREYGGNIFEKNVFGALMAIKSTLSNGSEVNFLHRFRARQTKRKKQKKKRKKKEKEKEKKAAGRNEEMN